MPLSTTPLYTKRTSSFHGPGEDRHRLHHGCGSCENGGRTDNFSALLAFVSSKSASKALAQESPCDDSNTAAKSDCSTHTRCGTYMRRASRSSTARLGAPKLAQDLRVARSTCCTGEIPQDHALDPHEHCPDPGRSCSELWPYPRSRQQDAEDKRSRPALAW